MKANSYSGLSAFFGKEDTEKFSQISTVLVSKSKYWLLLVVRVFLVL